MEEKKQPYGTAKWHIDKVEITIKDGKATRTVHEVDKGRCFIFPSSTDPEKRKKNHPDSRLFADGRGPR